MQNNIRRIKHAWLVNEDCNIYVQIKEYKVKVGASDYHKGMNKLSPKKHQVCIDYESK